MKTYKTLQVSRFVAALLVVLFHLGGAIAADKYFGLHSFATPFSFGDAGVEFFFVLSGFIIFTAHRSDIGRSDRLLPYFSKRFIRIYPTYWIAFAAVASFAIASGTFGASVPHDPVLLIKTLLLLPLDKDVVGGTGAPLLIVAWTLQYEMLFYCWVGIAIAHRATAGVLALGAFAYYIWQRGNAAPFPGSFVAVDYVWLFGMGIAAAVATHSNRVKINCPLLWALCGAILFAALALDEVLAYNLAVDFRTLLYGVASTMLVIGLVRAEDQGRIAAANPIGQLLGDASYALYLIHFPLISLLCKVCVAVGLPKAGLPGAILAFVVIAAVCVIIAVMFHLAIEKPVSAFLRSKLLAPNRIPVARPV